MAYVPVAKHDVFIARPIEAWNWFDNLKPTLGKSSCDLLPPNELDIYTARRGWSLGRISADALMEAAQSVLFVAVLVRSVFSSHEGRSFRREWASFKQSSNLFGLA